MTAPRVIAVDNQRKRRRKTDDGRKSRRRPIGATARATWVLAPDLDKRSNLTLMLGQRSTELPGTMTDVFTGRPLDQCLTTDPVSRGLSLVGGDSRLADEEFNLASAKRREEVLARQLEGKLVEFDYVLIDCPPNQGLLAINAVVLASELLVPVRMTDPNSINGLGDLRSFLEEMADAGWERPIRAVLRLDVDRRLDLYQTFNETLATLRLPISPIEIPSRTAVGKSAARGEPIARGARTHPPASRISGSQHSSTPCQISLGGGSRRWRKSTSSSTIPSCAAPRWPLAAQKSNRSRQARQRSHGDPRPGSTCPAVARGHRRSQSPARPITPSARELGRCKPPCYCPRSCGIAWRLSPARWEGSPRPTGFSSRFCKREEPRRTSKPLTTSTSSCLTAEQNGVGERWEEHSLRLPTELRDRLADRRGLTAAGIRDATRAHLVAATVLLRGPTTAEQAQELMAERRAEAFRRALSSPAQATESGPGRVP